MSYYLKGNMMKKLIIGILVSLLIVSSSGAAFAGYMKTGYDKDYLACSDIAQSKAKGLSDAMYLGVFYGCMSDRGYDISSI